MDLDEEKLIFEVQSRPILYDKQLVDYKNVNKREKLWKDVAVALGSDVNSSKKRWRSLRDVFIKLYRQMRTLPSGSTRYKKKTWPFYSSMEFLIPFIEFKETTGHYVCQSPPQFKEDSELQIEKVQDEQVLDKEELSFHSQNSHTLQERKFKTAEIVRKRKRLTTSTDSTETKVIKILAEKDDPDELFLMSLLPSLKRLCPKKNSEARIKLQQVLYDLEYSDQEEQFCSNRSRRSSFSKSARSSALSLGNDR